MRRGGLVAVLLAAVVATGCGGRKQLGGTIVFQSGNSGRAAVYGVAPDGSGLRRLAIGLPVAGADIAWSPDGSKALVSYDDGHGGAITYVDDVAHRRRLRQLRGLQLYGNAQPEDLTLQPWSPDGTRLLVSTRKADIVLDLKTGSRRRIDDALDTDLLTWSGDGKRILFPTDHEIWFVPASGGPARFLLSVGTLEPGDLHSSFDGAWVSFQAYGASTEGLYVIRADGTGLRLVAGDAESSAWSPTDDRLAFATPHGFGVFDAKTGRHRLLTSNRLDDPPNEGPAWSPDGSRILYYRSDLPEAAAYPHLQLWTMRADGSGRQPVTRAFANEDSAVAGVWVSAALPGSPEPKLPVATLTGLTLTTQRPVAGLGAGARAAVTQGLGGIISDGAKGLPPLGPLVTWDPRSGATTRQAVRGCSMATDVVVVGGRVGYRCDRSYAGYSVYDTLRLGTRALAHTHGEEFSGTFLGGIVTDGTTIVFDVGDVGKPRWGHFSIRVTRVREAAVKGKPALLRSLDGSWMVTSLQNGRVAAISGRRIAVLSRAGLRTFTLGRGQVLGAALDGGSLVALQARRISVLDLATGRVVATRAVLRALGPLPQLEDVRGELVVYAVGATIHVLRLSDGREVVADTPNATGPVFARLVPGGLFYAYNEAYAKHPGRVVFVKRSDLQRALATVRRR